MPKFVDFKAVKSAVSMLQVLKHYGIAETFKRNGDTLSGPCPLHNGQNPTQFRISDTKNCWHCFGRCNTGGNVLEFVSKKEETTLREAALKLSDWFDLPLAEKPESKQNPNSEKSKKIRKSSPTKELAARIDEDMPNQTLGFKLENLDANHPYLAERGLLPECIAHFGLGYCEKGSMKGRIAIPIHNPEGQLVAYAGRWPGTPPDDTTPKYKLPPGFRKGRELFNAHCAFAALSETPPNSVPTLVIVEGFFDCLTLWQHGVRSVVALMGSSLSTHQEELIAQRLGHNNRILLMLDEDPAGRNARNQIAPRLAEISYLKTFRFKLENQQPDSLTQNQIANAIT